MYFLQKGIVEVFFAKIYKKMLFPYPWIITVYCYATVLRILDCEGQVFIYDLSTKILITGTPSSRVRIAGGYI